jgi:hypothetical protein
MDDRGRRDGDERSSSNRYPDGTVADDRSSAEDRQRETRRDADRAAADEARLRLRERGIVPIEPDHRIATMLHPDEAVVTFRASVAIDRRVATREPDAGLQGDLYVTTDRVVHLGRSNLSLDLDEISEAAIVGDTLRLVLDNESAVSLAVNDPRLLRVQIAAAREARVRR